MISGRRGAPGLAGSVYGVPTGAQYGIGYYESVGDEAPAVVMTAATPQVVLGPMSAGSEASALRKNAFLNLALLSFSLAAAWAGFQLTREAKRA